MLTFQIYTQNQEAYLIKKKKKKIMLQGCIILNTLEFLKLGIKEYPQNDICFLKYTQSL